MRCAVRSEEFQHIAQFGFVQGGDLILEKKSVAIRDGGTDPRKIVAADHTIFIIDVDFAGGGLLVRNVGRRLDRAAAAERRVRLGVRQRVAAQPALRRPEEKTQPVPARGAQPPGALDRGAAGQAAGAAGRGRVSLERAHRLRRDRHSQRT